MAAGRCGDAISDPVHTPEVRATRLQWDRIGERDRRVARISAPHHVAALGEHEDTVHVGAAGSPGEHEIFLRRFISQGSINNFRVRALFHFTIDANGNLTASFDSTERICD
jgi:hypothetical protein